MPVFFFKNILVLFITFLISIPCAYSETQKKVLVVHSYHKNQTGHVDEMNYGIMDGIKGECSPDIKYFYMNTKNKNSLEWKIQSGIMAEALMDKYKPDVVITMDDNAQEFFAKKTSIKKGSPFFVFSGVNAEPSKYNFNPLKVTGVLERPNIKESIELLLKIDPSVKTIVLLSDKSPTTDAFHKYVKSINLPVKVLASVSVKTFSEWKYIINKYKNRVDAFGVYVLRTIKNDLNSNKIVSEKKLISYLNSNSKLPNVGFFDTSAQAGLLCGISVSMKEQGYEAGKIACAILNGKKPYDFSIKPTSHGRILLNLKTAENLNLELKYTIIKNADEVIR